MAIADKRQNQKQKAEQTDELTDCLSVRLSSCLSILTIGVSVRKFSVLLASALFSVAIKQQQPNNNNMNDNDNIGEQRQGQANKLYDYITESM